MSCNEPIFSCNETSKNQQAHHPLVPKALSCGRAWSAPVKSRLFWCKQHKNDKFHTKNFPNQKFLYGIYLFCLYSENGDFSNGKIPHFCIFFVQNGDLNTNKISTDCPDATLTKRITITLRTVPSSSQSSHQSSRYTALHP